MYTAPGATELPIINCRGFSGWSLYILAVTSSCLLANASPTGVADVAPDGTTLTQAAVKSLASVREALQSTGNEVTQNVLMRRAKEEDPITSKADHAEDDSEEDSEDDPDSDDDPLADTGDANQDLESSLVEKTSVRRCTSRGRACRRRRFNLCKRENCGAAAKSFYRAPKSTYHCMHCRNMIHVISKRYARRMKRMGFAQIGNGASLISRGNETVHDRGKDQLLSVEEMRRMPSEALTQLIEAGEGALCSFRNSFSGCGLQKSFFGPKVYRCGKCWRSRWYPKKAPNVFDPYAMRGPPGPPGPPGPSGRGRRGRRGARHRRRRRNKRGRKGKSRRRRRRKKRSSLLSTDEESALHNDGLDQEMNEGFSEAS